jgi:type II secretory pathway pseudopilin PulG
MSSTSPARGFTLLETLIATGILVTALAGLAQLFVLSTHLTRNANAAGAALLAAQDKLENLRGLVFSYDHGDAVTAPAVQPSPPNSLNDDVAPYVDWLDAAGVTQDAAGGATLVRRWRVSRVGVAIPDAITIEVCVFRMPASERGFAGADACLSTVRTRQP